MLKIDQNFKNEKFQKKFEKCYMATLQAFQIQDNRQQIWYEKDTSLSEIDLRE